MKTSRLLVMLCASGFMLVTSASHAELQGRAPKTAGGTDYQAYYDTNLDITWAADANMASRRVWSIGEGEFNAIDWVNDFSLEGVGGWRLPNVDRDNDIFIECSDEFTITTDCLDNEFGYMFWKNGVTGSNPGPFSNLQPDGYWSGKGINDLAWLCDFGNGGTFTDLKTFALFVWPVHDGDVFPTDPAPPSSPRPMTWIPILLEE